jgi:hypothetical protein
MSNDERYPDEVPTVPRRQRFTVVRGVWDRGHDDGDTKLLGDRGSCCLGFLALYCGYKAHQIRDLADPTDFLYRDSKLPATLAIPEDLGPYETIPQGLCVSPLCRRIISANDCVIGTPECSFGSEEDRETLLTELFFEAGIDVEFV